MFGMSFNCLYKKKSSANYFFILEQYIHKYKCQRVALKPCIFLNKEIKKNFDKIWVNKK